MTIKAKDEETTSVMPDLIRYPEKTKLDCRIKSGNDKQIIYPLSFSCEHGRDTGIQETKGLDYPVK